MFGIHTIYDTSSDIVLSAMNKVNSSKRRDYIDRVCEREKKKRIKKKISSNTHPNVTCKFFFIFLNFISFLDLCDGLPCMPHDIFLLFLSHSYLFNLIQIFDWTWDMTQCLDGFFLFYNCFLSFGLPNIVNLDKLL